MINNRLLFSLLAFLSLDPAFGSNQKSDHDLTHVGFANVDVTPPVGVPLAGYGGGNRRLLVMDIFNKYPYATHLAPSVGVQDPIRAKAMVIRRGDKRLVFVSLDAIGAPKDIVDDLREKLDDLNLSENELFVSATHTHSGPGALTRNPLWQLIAVDAFNKNIYNPWIEGVANSVRQAYQNAEPAVLLANTFEVPGAQNNRRGNFGHFDREGNMLAALSENGKWLGAMVNLAIHGTTLPSSDLLLSSDILGMVERKLERKLSVLNNSPGKDPTVLYINGAEGDVSPDGKGIGPMERISEDFSNKVVEALPFSREIDPVWKVSSRKVKLGVGNINIGACTREHEAPSLYSFHQKPQVKVDLLYLLRLYIPFLLPTKVSVWSIQLGDMVFLTWPGEPTTSLGLASKKVALDAGARQAWVFGLTNDHLAYFTTPTEFHEGGYEACVSMYGSNGGAKILSAHADMNSASMSSVSSTSGSTSGSGK